VVAMLCTPLVGIGSELPTYRTQIVRQPNNYGP
jgi:hypothetical protein